MKKKIEKIPDDKKYYEESEFVEEVIEKLNQIIDHLNSQVQPEEIDNTKLVMPPSAYDQAEKEGFNMKNKVKSKLLPQDTPEEWVEKLWKLIDAYRDSKDITSELERIEEVNQYVKQLLEERETFTKGELNNLLDWIENGYVPSIEVRDEIDKGIIKK